MVNCAPFMVGGAGCHGRRQRGRGPHGHRCALGCHPVAFLCTGVSPGPLAARFPDQTWTVAEVDALTALPLAPYCTLQFDSALWQTIARS